MAKLKVNIIDNAWTTLQEADAEKHILEISCRASAGKVVEVRIRHNDGEEEVAKIMYEGKAALPMDIKTFTKLYKAEKLEI